MRLTGFILCCFLGINWSIGLAQTHNYIAPNDSLVRVRLQEWQDLKFGLFMHWGPYSQWSVVESWSLCPEDEGWTQRKGVYAANYFDYVKAYERLQTTFYPIQFNPQKWVDAARHAGMKYMIFTTKHHDGFCMFDSRQTDYTITNARSAFSSSPRSNVTKEIFQAFRNQGFKIGAYFSKPDWHNTDYWWPYFPPLDRNVNYDPKKYPEKWNAFKSFTYNQIEELMRDYGKVDILWLDGGWVRPLKTVDRSVSWQKSISKDQDIDLPKIAAMARTHQPGLIVVDRTVTGEYENYTTPEQEVPQKPLPYPWETCMTMGNSWSYVKGDQYKSANQLIHLLVKIVSRGGNLLLNIGPGPDGDWDPVAYQRLSEIGEWMKINSACIYDTKPIAPYSSGNVFFTQHSPKGEDSNTIFAVYLLEENGPLPAGELLINGLSLGKNSKIVSLETQQELPWSINRGQLKISLKGIYGNIKHALVLKIVNVK